MEIDFEEVITIYLNIGWGKRRSIYSAARLKKAFTQSSFVVAAFLAGRLVGWGRALSDGVANTWIVEVVVDPDCQRKGLGRRLVEAIEKRYSHTAIWAETYLPTKTFGEKCGLKARDGMVVISRGPQAHSP
ncbi:MAG: GNAT family N-acetyltransferase [Spirochaetales bacterium]|nr:GNAT family N-acetyltransferase [Spirochaetales bacterium]